MSNNTGFGHYYDSPNCDAPSFDFAQPWMHFLLCQADATRKEYGATSTEYGVMIARLAQQLSLYFNGASFTMEEMKHYSEKHEESLRDAAVVLQQSTGIPIQQFVTGIQFSSILPDLGNADGSPFTPHHNFKGPNQPDVYRGLLRPDENKGRKQVAGIEIYSSRMAATSKQSK